MEISPEIFGYAGTITGVSFMLPQVWKSWRTKRVEDISLGMLMILGLNCFLWFTYGFLHFSFPLMLANGLTFAVLLLQMYFKMAYTKRV